MKIKFQFFNRDGHHGHFTWHPEHAIIWTYEPRQLLLGFTYVNYLKAGFPWFAFDVYLPLLRIWYKYEWKSELHRQATDSKLEYTE